MSKEKLLAEYNQNVADVYRQRTPKSMQVIDNACKYVPDGDMRISIWFEPYPTVMDRGDSCRLYDVDGNEYLDFSNNWTSMVLGNNHPKVVEAITRQAPRGSAMAAPPEAAYEWARLLCDRIPSVERVMFPRYFARETPLKAKRSGMRGPRKA